MHRTRLVRALLVEGATECRGVRVVVDPSRREVREDRANRRRVVVVGGGKRCRWWVCTAAECSGITARMGMSASLSRRQTRGCCVTIKRRQLFVI